ncbi:hypothetical protein ISCGN_026344 [Ixodes scapularis]
MPEETTFKMAPPLWKRCIEVEIKPYAHQCPIREEPKNKVCHALTKIATVMHFTIRLPTRQRHRRMLALHNDDDGNVAYLHEKEYFPALFTKVILFAQYVHFKSERHLAAAAPITGVPTV